MKPIRLFFYVLLIFYHVVLIAFALNLNDSVAQNLIDSASTVLIFTFIGFALFLVVFGLAWFDRRRFQRRLERLEAEKNEIKAQVYDMKRREDEIDQEIKSFESSLDAEKKPTDDPLDTDQRRLT
ncbi:MAG: hypothetical protein WBA23_18760 [Tunicatimonas sp.]|uniref:hypothetical protein n=1 Tax=Tunicatimonas sp. TaxID=1940096 RepID=UPI003C71B146